jgi:Arc/MetJ-type ribon-helix-helix transcriptional regulator
MAAKIKYLVSVRLPVRLVERMDFAIRNLDGEDAPSSRSAVILAAVKAWLPAKEKRLRELGLDVE